jgi:mono/diheme cytochrome c family protein
MAAPPTPRTKPKHVYGLAALIAAAALAAPLVPPGFAGGSATPPKVVNVTLRDNGIGLSSKAAPVGKVRFMLKNTGKRPHNFKVANRTSKTLAGGKSTTLLVTFARQGSYGYLSTAKGDTARAFKGKFKVTPTPASSAGNARAGRAVFVANCGTCHVLKAASTRGAIGPNLDTSKAMTFAALTKIVMNGKPGTAMPGFKTTLSAEQIQDVSAFVFDATH